jgi:hypothetical protein
VTKIIVTVVSHPGGKLVPHDIAIEIDVSLDLENEGVDHTFNTGSLIWLTEL